jgi:hypothetical protein
MCAAEPSGGPKEYRDAGVNPPAKPDRIIPLEKNTTLFEIPLYYSS